MKVRLVIPPEAYTRHPDKAQTCHFDREWNILPPENGDVFVEELDINLEVRSLTWMKDLVWIVLRRPSLWESN